MSTKVTLSHNDDYHLYQECYENDNVHLQLDNATEASIISRADSKTKATIAIPIKIWRHMVEGWLSTQWAQDESRDNATFEYDAESLTIFLNKVSDSRASEGQE